VFARAAKSETAILSALENVVFLDNNCEVGEGIETAKKYNVRGYPTFIMVNGDGEVCSAWLGYPGPEKWAAHVLAGDKDQRTVEEKMAAFDKQATKELACSLANSSAASYDFAGSVKYYRSARDIDPAGAREYTTEILTNMYYGSRGGAFTLDEVTAEADMVMASKESTPEDIMDVAMMIGAMSSQMGQQEASVPYIKAAMKASEGVEELAESRKELAIDHALLVEKDTQKALTLRRESMDEGWKDDPRSLNQFAWWCFENDVNLEEAKTLAMRGAELADDDSAKANLLDTAAEICNAMDNCEEAVELMRQAVKLSPERDHFQTQLARFEQILAEKDKG
jgi:tetratricopeptide (TPR) repeat protein